MSSSSTVLNHLPVSSYIDIAPNEYVTKYSFNRNFEKLLSNDNYLYEQTGNDGSTPATEEEWLKRIQTYNKLKTYDAGEFVFYKIQKSDTKFYILSSVQGPNTHKPMVSKNAYTDELFVVNSDWWVIVGIDPDKGNSLPKDQADMHVNDCRQTFNSNHQDNADLNAHPTGILGLQKSSKLFKTLENIEEDRSKFFYPGYIQSFVADNTTYFGYMRKWDNGLLEYDLTFRLGYISSDESGLDIISANNLAVSHRNNNFMYFKDDEDYKIFNHGGDNYVVTPTSKQVNLNTQMNAYSGQIKFIEPFKDLNYMVFASNTKSIETEAFNLKNSAIRDYDCRLVLDGLAVVGCQKDAVFNTPCKIPNDAINIKNGALEGIEQVDNVPVEFILDPWQSKLANIDSYAFSGTDIYAIDIPASVRYIAPYAFSNCSKLTCVNFYLHDDASLQARIDKGAFPFGVKEVNFFYESDRIGLFGASPPSHEMLFTSNTRLEQKMAQDNYRAYIGMNADSSFIKINSSRQNNSSLLGASTFRRMAQSIEDAQTIEETQDLEQHQNNVFTIDVDELLNEISSMQQSNFSAIVQPKMRFAAIKPAIDINNVFKMSGTTITGFNAIDIDGQVGFDLSRLTTAPTRIQANALTGFNQLTGLTANTNMTTIDANALPTNLQSLVLRAGNTNSQSYNIDSTVIEDLSVVITGTKSFQLTAYASNLSIDGNGGKAVPSNAIHGQVDNLIVYDSMTINSRAFFDCYIDNCEIRAYANEGNTTLGANIFGYDTASSPEETITISRLQDSLSLVGKLWIINSQALANINIHKMSIDINSSVINANAFYNSSINFMSIKNLAIASHSTVGSIDYYGFQAQSFNNLELGLLAITDMPFADITTEYLKPSTMEAMMASYMIVRGSDMHGSWWNSDTKTYADFDIAIFNIEGTTLKGFAEGISIPEDIDIPYGITSIADNAFYNADASVYSNVTDIYIPASITSIGTNAFRNLQSLDSVNIEPGTRLTMLGANAFDQNVNLDSLAFYA